MLNLKFIAPQGLKLLVNDSRPGTKKFIKKLKRKNLKILICSVGTVNLFW
jgi:hypothetical protein